MKSTTRTAAALVAATIGLAALTPAAFAAGPNGPGNDHGGRQMHQRQGGDGEGMRGGGVLNLICAPNGAERLEKKLVSLSYDAKLTDAQKPLYEALKTAALTAQTGFADTCATILPAAPAADAAAATTPAERPDMLEMLQTRLKIDEARVAALTSVMPSFETFFNSLSDEQKAALAPQGRMGGDDHRGGPGRGGDDDHRGGPRQGRNG